MKTRSGISTERINQVEPKNMRAYLTQVGWKEIEYPDKRVWVYAPPQEKGLAVPVPATRKLKDYHDLADRLIITLADVEECTCEDAFQLLCNHSILKMRAVDESTPRGTLPLPSADVLIKKTRDLIAYSTCAEVGQPRRYYSKPARQAKDHANQYELGQTEPGSFIINIIAPATFVSENATVQLMDVDPLEHRVIRRIVRGAKTVQDAVRHSDASIIADGFMSGFNANMCDIVADTIEQAGIDELSFSALGITNDEDDGRNNNALLTDSSIPQLEKASLMLREAPVDEYVVITGFITLLRNEDNGEPDRQRHIQVAWGAKSVNVHLILDDKDYIIACDAHRDRKRIVVEGTLHHEKRKFFLHTYRNFHVEGSSQRNLF